MKKINPIFALGALIFGLYVVDHYENIDKEEALNARLDGIEAALTDDEYGPNNPFNPTAVANGSTDPDDIYGPLV